MTDAIIGGVFALAGVLVGFAGPWLQDVRRARREDRVQYRKAVLDKVTELASIIDSLRRQRVELIVDEDEDLEILRDKAPKAKLFALAQVEQLRERGAILNILLPNDDLYDVASAVGLSELSYLEALDNALRAPVYEREATRRASDDCALPIVRFKSAAKRALGVR